MRHIVGSEGVQQAKGMSVSGRYEDRYHSMWERNSLPRVSRLYLSAENWTNTAKPIGTLTLLHRSTRHRVPVNRIDEDFQLSHHE